MKKFLTVAMVLLALITACNNEKKPGEATIEKMSEDSPEAKEEKNKETALASVNALIAGDIEATIKNAAKDVVEYGDGTMVPIKGLDSLKAALQIWRGTLSEYKADNIWAIADGDYVAVFGDWNATFKTDYMGMNVAGKSFKVKDVDYFKFNSDGKITEHHNVQSSASMMQQLGVAPK